MPQDIRQLSDEQLLAMLSGGGQTRPPPPPQPQPQPPPRPQPRPEPQQRPTFAPVPADQVDVAAIMPHLIQQESSGQPGVLGPQTAYGRAEGLTQMLPATAQEMANRLGVPWRPELMRGTSEEAAAYQRQLGQAYFEQGLRETGNLRDAFMYYHGGPDRSLWGPRTNRYADELMARVQGGAPVSPITPTSPDPGGVQAMSDEALLAALEQQGAPMLEQPAQPSADIRSPSGLRPVTGYVMDPIAGGSQEQPIDVERLSPEQINALGEGIIGQYIRQPDGSIALVRDIGDPQGEIGDPAQVGATGIRYYEADPNMERMGALAQSFTEQIPFGMDYAAGVAGALTGEGYSNTRDLLDEAAAEQRQFNPNLRRAGGIAGFGATLFATPGGSFIGRGASQADRALRAGGVGLGTGLVYGAGTGRGDLGERAERAALTGATGAGGGMLFQRLADALAPQAVRLGEAVRPTLSGIERRVSGALGRGLGREEQTLADVLQGVSRGQTPYEASPALAQMAELLYQTPGPGQRVVREAVGDRIAGMPQRVRGSIEDTLGGNRGYFAELDRLQEARRVEAQQGMAQIGGVQVPMSPEAIRAIRADLSTPAIRAAAQEAMADISPQAGESANRLFGLVQQAIDDPSAVRLTVQEAQDISYALREAASRAYRGGFNSRGAALQGMSRAIRSSATDSVPEYAAWLQRYGDDSANIEALEMGRNVLSPGFDMNSENIQRRLADMPGPAREYFRRGVGEALYTRAEAAGDARVVRDLIRVPGGEMGNRIRLAFPDERAFDDFMEMAQREAGAADVAQRIRGGSQTYGRQATRQDMEAEGIPAQLLEGASDVADLRFGSAIRRGIGVGVRALDQASRDQRGVLTNPEANRLLAQAVTDPDTLRDLMSRAAAREEIPGFSRQALAQLADVLSRRAGPVAEQFSDPLLELERRRATQ